MIQLINKFTGTPMWVADDREKEYLAAGHKKPASEAKAEEKPTAKKRPAKAKKEG